MHGINRNAVRVPGLPFCPTRRDARRREWGKADGERWFRLGMLGRKLLCILLLSMVAAPASGTWGSLGSFEPDTLHDVEDGFMWLEPDVSDDTGVRQIYFNAILAPSKPWVNPNSGALQSRIQLPGFQSPMAFLGIWKDCNADGYIGHAETALLEYRSTLLLGIPICPEIRGLDIYAPGYHPPHNDGEWVREFLWIGPTSNAANVFGIAQRVLGDEEARVWGDEGKPGSRPSPVCPVNPPTGTFATTGGLIAYADCHGNHGVTKRFNAVDAQLSAGLGFPDPESPQCSGSIANQRLGVFGDDPRCPESGAGLLERNSGRPAFQAFGCGEGTELPAPGGGTLVYVPAAGEPKVDTQGSVYDSLGRIEAASRKNCQGSGEDSTADAAYPALNPERSITASDAKRENTFALEFTHDRARSVTGRLVESEGTPSDAGIVLASRLFRIGPGWSTETAQANPFLFRENLAIKGAQSWTFYARVGPDTILRGVSFYGGMATYGSEWCASGFHGIQNGVDCDPSRWFDPAHGAGGMPRSYWSHAELGVRPGTIYQLRDVDCYDGSVASTAPATVAWLSEEGGCPGLPG